MKLRHVAVTMVASLVAFTVAQAPLADTDVGQSGSALIGDCPGGNGLCSVGIHTNGHEINNFGVRMIDEVYDNLVSWLDD